MLKEIKRVTCAINYNETKVKMVHFKLHPSYSPLPKIHTLLGQLMLQLWDFESLTEHEQVWIINDEWSFLITIYEIHWTRSCKKHKSSFSSINVQKFNNFDFWHDNCKYMLKPQSKLKRNIYIINLKKDQKLKTGHLFLDTCINYLVCLVLLIGCHGIFNQHY